MSSQPVSFQHQNTTVRTLTCTFFDLKHYHSGAVPPHSATKTHLFIILYGTLQASDDIHQIPHHMLRHLKVIISAPDTQVSPVKAHAPHSKSPLARPKTYHSESDQSTFSSPNPPISSQTIIFRPSTCILQHQTNQV